MGGLEGAHALAHDKLVELSVQNIVDCSGKLASTIVSTQRLQFTHAAPYGNSGCNGGNMYKVYQYIIDNQGVDTEKSYPYSRKVAFKTTQITEIVLSDIQRGQCHFRKETVGASQVGIIRLPVGNEDGLQEAVATAGPVSVAVDGSSSGFRVRKLPNLHFYASLLCDTVLRQGDF